MFLGKVLASAFCSSDDQETYLERQTVVQSPVASSSHIDLPVMTGLLAGWLRTQVGKRALLWPHPAFPIRFENVQSLNLKVNISETRITLPAQSEEKPSMAWITSC